MHSLIECMNNYTSQVAVCQALIPQILYKYAMISVSLLWHFHDALYIECIFFCFIHYYMQKKEAAVQAAPKMLSIVISLDLEVSLGMCANGAHTGSILANVDVSAVGALPYSIAVT